MAAGGKGGVLDEDDKPCGTARRLVARFDRFAAEVAQRFGPLEADVAVLRRELVQAKADLAQTKAAVKDGLRSAPTEPEAEAKGQPEWIGCTDADEAHRILLAVDEWMDRYGRTLAVPDRPCWPWHPHVVALLLAASRQHTEVYQGKAGDKVSDYLVRVLPAISDRIRKILDATECNAHVHKDEPGGTPYAVHLDQVPDLAAWWATDREGLAPGLTRRLGATG